MWDKIKKFFYNLFTCEPKDLSDVFPDYPKSIYDNSPGVDEEASTPIK